MDAAQRVPFLVTPQRGDTAGDRRVGGRGARLGPEQQDLPNIGPKRRARRKRGRHARIPITVPAGVDALRRNPFSHNTRAV
jgi:hypothetical protein